MAVLLGSTGAMAAEQIKRQPCPKTEQQEQQQQQRQQQAQQRERAKPQGCPVYRNIPPAVDPTPYFLL
jgi:hypothetical protein